MTQQSKSNISINYYLKITILSPHSPFDIEWFTIRKKKLAGSMAMFWEWIDSENNSSTYDLPLERHEDTARWFFGWFENTENGLNFLLQIALVFKRDFPDSQFPRPCLCEFNPALEEEIINLMQNMGI